MASAAPAVAHGTATKRRSFALRNARLILPYLVLAILLIVYQQKSPRFTEREWRSISNQGMTLTISGMG